HWVSNTSGSVGETLVTAVRPTPSTRLTEKRTEETDVTPSTCSRPVATADGSGKPSALFCTISEPGRAAVSTASAIVAFSPWAKIDTNATSVTPTTSADAVTAVRPGWRTEFSRASWPTTPGNIRPSDPASG